MPASPRRLARGQRFSSAATPKPSGGIRSYLAVRLWLANAASCPCLYLQCYFSKALLVQTVNFILYGVCKFVFLGSPLGHPKGVPCAELSPQVTEGFPATAANRFHKELRFFFSLLKRKKEAKKEKSSHFTCATRSNITRRLRERLRTRAIYFHRFSSTKIPRRGKQAAAAAVTLPLSQLKLGRRVSGGLLSLSKSAVAISAGRRADPPRKEAKKEKNSRSTCTIWQMHHTKCCLVIF